MIALLWLLFACSGGSQEPAATEPTPPKAQPAAGGHGSGGDHMAVMAATREGLRTTLGEAYDQPVPGLDQASIERGKAVYDEKCASCHGATGKGDGAAGASLDPLPADFTDAFHARYYSDAGRVQIIRAGSDGTAMKGFAEELTDQQMLDVYAYVRTFRGDVAPAAIEHDHSTHSH